MVEEVKEDVALNPDKGQEKTTPKKEEGEPKPELINITVDGQQRQVTMDELKKMAELSGGAQEKFRKAAELSKEAQKGKRLQELVVKGRTEELAPTEWEEFADALGISLEELQEEMTPKAPPAAAAPPPNPSPAPLSMKDLPKEVQEKLAVLDAMTGAQKRSAVVTEIKTAVDKDKFLGKITSKDERTRDLVHDLVIREVQDRVLAGEREYSPEVVGEAIQYARAVVDGFSKLGIPPPMMGLGPSEGALMSQQFHTGKVPERVPVTDPDYIEKQTQRVLANEAARG